MLSGLRLRRGLVLGRRDSAKTVFQKSELASCSRSDIGLLKNNADFRQPRIRSPPAESGDRQHTPHGLAFQGGSVGGAARELDEPSALRWTAGRKGWGSL